MVKLVAVIDDCGVFEVVGLNPTCGYKIAQHITA